MENRHDRSVRNLIELPEMNSSKEIILTTINAKWIHPSLALRLLKANLGSLENSCEIIEFALRQPLDEKLEPFLTVRPRILGVSVSIWNHLATIELLKELEKIWADKKPVVVLGGPEVSYLPSDAEIFDYADHVIRGEGETAFRELCEKILQRPYTEARIANRRFEGELVKTAYHLYSDEDVSKKLIYVESGRGCPFNCDFCLSALDDTIYEFPLEQFLADMDILIQRGVKTFKFLDRSFNINIPRALQIIGFFLGKIENLYSSSVNSSPNIPFTVHFEMVPSLFPPELLQALARFPPGTLRIEIGVQTLNPQVGALINRPSNPDKELETVRFLREKSGAVIHADLIAGLPGEDLVSFGKGFDLLWTAGNGVSHHKGRMEIQLGILKRLPGAPISRHNDAFGMRYNPLPPYEIEKTSSVSEEDMRRIKNFARFWEIIVNRQLADVGNGDIFWKFMTFSDELLARFGRNWGIDKEELRAALGNYI